MDHQLWAALQLAKEEAQREYNFGVIPMSPASNERRNVIIPSDWWDAFAEAAKKAGKSVSEWLRDAGADKLPARVRAKLSEAKGVGRPKKPDEDVPK